jgi:uncharacterized protein with PQ loop repeat
MIDPYFIGVAGNILFGVKSLPQIIESYKSKSVNGVSTAMLVADFLGNTCCAYFIFATTGFVLWPQFLNYFLATLFLIILFIMKIIYRR